MSLMGMRHAVKKYGMPIWILLALALVVTSFVGFGSNLFQGNDPVQAEAAEAPLATIGDTRIARSAFDRQVAEILNQQRQFNPNPSPLSLLQVRVMLLEQLKQQKALEAAAKANGVTISDADLAAAREQAWQEQRTQIATMLGLKEGATDAEMRSALSRVSPDATMDDLKREMLPDEALRANLYRDRLAEKFKPATAGAPKVTEEFVRKAHSDLHVRHILIPTGSTPGALPDAQAKAKAQKLLDLVKKDVSQMPQLAKENSSDGSKAQGGLLPWSPGTNYVHEFTSAAVTLKKGEVYPEVVKSPFGYHIIKLEDIKPGASLPKDFDTNKQKYMDEYQARLDQPAQQAAMEKVQQAVTAALPSIKVEVNDPATRAFQLQMEAFQTTDKKQKEAKLTQALAELDKAKPAEDVGGMLPLLKASILEEMGKRKEAIAAYEQSLLARNSLDTRLTLARLHLAEKDKASAVKELQEAEKLVRGEIFQQRQIAGLYKEAGRTDLASAAEQKAKELETRQAALNKKTPAAGGANFGLEQVGGKDAKGTTDGDKP